MIGNVTATHDDARAAPSVEAVVAFGGNDVALTRLAGGQGTSWRAGTIVLKRVDDEREVAWLADLLAHVPDGPKFRVGRPIAAPDGSYAVDGWGASRWLEGAHAPGRFDDRITASDAFHRSLAAASVPWPDVLRDRSSPWATADRVAWAEADLRAEDAGLRGTVDRMLSLATADWNGHARQVIHGDIGGNILFADARGLAPAIIDISPYCRPAAFATAILVADAVAWEHAPMTLAERFVASDERRADLLARAVVFRLAAALTLWGATSARVGAELDAYRPVVSMLALP